MLQIRPVQAFSDNYVWILGREGSSRVAVVDPGDAAPVIEALAERDLEVAAILVTHHHRDHVGGVDELVRRFDPAVWGSAGETVPGVDHRVSGGDRVELHDLELDLEVVALPGHTAGHVGYLGSGFVFVGDTLFAGGCGRVFEGTFEEMHGSLARLAALPPDTEVFCAHEYTVANLRFARVVEPANQALAERLTAARARRADNRPTVPSTVAAELATNPFLRCSEPAVVAAAVSHAGRSLGAGAETFGVLRTWKDGWAG